MFKELWETLGPEYGLLVVILMVAVGTLASAIVALFYINSKLMKHVLENDKLNTEVLTKLELVLTAGMANLKESVDEVRRILFDRLGGKQ